MLYGTTGVIVKFKKKDERLSFSVHILIVQFITFSQLLQENVYERIMWNKIDFFNISIPVFGNTVSLNSNQNFIYLPRYFNIAYILDRYYIIYNREMEPQYYMGNWSFFISSSHMYFISKS